MSWRIVKQPNGLLARFSDIVDNFTDMNLIAADALDVCMANGCTFAEAEVKVQNGMKDYKPWTEKELGSGHDRWDDSIATIRRVHGDDAVDEVLQMVSVSR